MSQKWNLKSIPQQVKTYGSPFRNSDKIYILFRNHKAKSLSEIEEFIITD